MSEVFDGTEVGRSGAATFVVASKVVICGVSGIYRDQRLPEGKEISGFPRGRLRSYSLKLSTVLLNRRTRRQSQRPDLSVFR